MGPAFLKELRRRFRLDPQTGKLFWSEGKRGAAAKGIEAGTEIDNVRKPYRRVMLYGCNYRVDRIVWAIHYGDWPPDKIEHIDGDDLNCRIENMRVKS